MILKYQKVNILKIQYSKKQTNKIINLKVNYLKNPQLILVKIWYYFQVELNNKYL